ncbi:MAG: hypothetical protein ACKO96_30545, partial [Flammeovirgaceae bacterium]
LLFFKTFIQWNKSRQPIHTGLAILIFWVFLGYGIPFLYSILIAPMLIVRYTIIVLPAIIVLIAWSMSLLKEKHLFLTVALCFLLSLIAFYQNEYYSKIQKEQWREVVKEVIKENKEPSIIFSYYSWHYNYYFRSLKSNKRSHHPQTVNYAQTIGSADYIWLIKGHERNIGASTQELDIIQKDFTLEKEIKFVDAQAALFVRKK